MNGRSVDKSNFDTGSLTAQLYVYLSVEFPFIPAVIKNNNKGNAETAAKQEKPGTRNGHKDIIGVQQGFQ